MRIQVLLALAAAAAAQSSLSSMTMKFCQDEKQLVSNFEVFGCCSAVLGQEEQCFREAMAARGCDASCAKSEYCTTLAVTIAGYAASGVL